MCNCSCHHKECRHITFHDFFIFFKNNYKQLIGFIVWMIFIFPAVVHIYDNLVGDKVNPLWKDGALALISFEIFMDILKEEEQSKWALAGFGIFLISLIVFLLFPKIFFSFLLAK